MRLLPEGSSPDAARLMETRSLRAFGDGLVSVILVPALALAGLSSRQVGAVITATLVG